GIFACCATSPHCANCFGEFVTLKNVCKIRKVMLWMRGGLRAYFSGGKTCQRLCFVSWVCLIRIGAWLNSRRPLVRRTRLAHGKMAPWTFRTVGIGSVGD